MTLEDSLEKHAAAFLGLTLLGELGMRIFAMWIAVHVVAWIWTRITRIWRPA